MPAIGEGSVSHYRGGMTPHPPKGGFKHKVRISPDPHLS
jgi:hypothetical protein